MLIAGCSSPLCSIMTRPCFALAGLPRADVSFSGCPCTDHAVLLGQDRRAVRVPADQLVALVDLDEASSVASRSLRARSTHTSPPATTTAFGRLPTLIVRATRPATAGTWSPAGAVVVVVGSRGCRAAAPAAGQGDGRDDGEREDRDRGERPDPGRRRPARRGPGSASTVGAWSGDAAVSASAGAAAPRATMRSPPRRALARRPPPARRARGRRPTGSGRRGPWPARGRSRRRSAAGTSGRSHAAAAGRRGGAPRASPRRCRAGRARRPVERVEQHAAERVDVGARVDALAADLLGRDVAERARPSRRRAVLPRRRELMRFVSPKSVR